jgi:hypothetical protein
MIILSEKCSPSVISIHDDDDDFITRGWHKVSLPKEGDRSNEESSKTDVTDLRSDNGGEVFLYYLIKYGVCCGKNESKDRSCIFGRTSGITNDIEVYRKYNNVSLIFFNISKTLEIPFGKESMHLELPI